MVKFITLSKANNLCMMLMCDRSTALFPSEPYKAEK